MKYRLLKLTLLSFTSFTLFGCNGTKDTIDPDNKDNNDNTDNNDNNDENFDFEEDKPSDMTGYYTIRFDSNGGTKIKNQYVKKDGLASEPTAPTNKELIFDGWYLSNNFVKKFDFSTKITTDYFLFAKWSEKTDGGDVVPPDGDDKTNHSPEGATLVDWYIVGSGSLFTKEWSVDGGVQLYSNPTGTDLACILNLTIKEGDIFKIKDNDSIWIGYSSVDSYNDPSNLGLNNFSSDADDNFVCNITSSYNIYLNEKDGNKNIWIAGAN